MKKRVITFFIFLLAFGISLAAIRATYFGSITGNVVSENYARSVNYAFEKDKYELGLRGVFLVIVGFLIMVLILSVRIYMGRRKEVLVHQLR